MVRSKWHLIGNINASSYRKKIFLKLAEKENTPTQLKNDTDIKISHVSRALAELVDLKVVICLTPKLNKNKIYGITKLGRKIKAALN